ncbi:hypothetical protein RUND412_006236 [Rhizina undulata]
MAPLPLPYPEPGIKNWFKSLKPSKPSKSSKSVVPLTVEPASILLPPSRPATPDPIVPPVSYTPYYGSTIDIPDDHEVYNNPWKKNPTDWWQWDRASGSWSSESAESRYNSGLDWNWGEGRRSSWTFVPVGGVRGGLDLKGLEVGTVSSGSSSGSGSGASLFSPDQEGNGELLRNPWGKRDILNADATVKIFGKDFVRGIEIVEPIIFLILLGFGITAIFMWVKRARASE